MRFTVPLLHCNWAWKTALLALYREPWGLILLGWEHLAPQILASSTPRLSFSQQDRLHCMTPFHSTAADHTCTTAMEKETVPAPQTQNQTKTPWDTHCPAQPSSWCPPCHAGDPPCQMAPRGLPGLWGRVGTFSAQQHPLSKKAKIPLDWGMLGMPFARPGGLQLIWTHSAVGLISMCGCHYGSISHKAQLGDAFLGRGMVGANRVEFLPLDIAFEPFFSRSCMEDCFIYNVLCVCVSKQANEDFMKQMFSAAVCAVSPAQPQTWLLL